MVSIVLPSLSDASPLHVAAAGVAAASLLAYKLLVSTPTPLQFAAKHGHRTVKLPRPLPNSSFFLGDLPELTRNRDRFLDWLVDKTLELDEQPHVRRLPLVPDTIMVCTPELVEDVYKTQNDVLGMGASLPELFADLIGKAFPMQDGAAWFHQRKVASKFFSARVYRDVATRLINKHFDRVLEVLERANGTGEAVDLSHLFNAFTLQTFAELGFGLDMDLIGCEDGHPLDRALAGAMPHILYRAQTPSWIWKLQRFFNIGREREYAKTTRCVRELVLDMVHKSIQLSKQRPREEAATLVELFIHAMEDGEAGITPEIMCDVAISFAIGGRDTSADALSWLLLMFSWHPHVELKLRQELWEKVPDLMAGKIRHLTMEQTQGLVYMEAVIKETLRLYPVVPASQRQALCDVVLVDGTFVPKGSVVGVSPYVMGRLESVWGPDAREFKPERFIDTETGKLLTVSSFKFNSFHAGPRVCIGMNLAMLELKLAVATMMSRYALEIAPNDGSYMFSATLTVKSPVEARVRPAPTTWEQGGQ